MSEHVQASIETGDVSSLLTEMGCMLEFLGADETITHYREHSQLPTPTIFGMVLMIEKQKRRQAEQPPSVPAQIDICDRVIYLSADQSLVLPSS